MRAPWWQVGVLGQRIEIRPEIADLDQLYLGAADMIEHLVGGRQCPVLYDAADAPRLVHAHDFAAALLVGLFRSVLQRQPTDFLPGASATLPEPIN